MHPEVFQFHFLGQQRIFYSYGLMLILAGCCGTLMMAYLARRSGADAWDAIYVALLAIVGGLVGALGLDVLVNYRLYWQQPQFPGMVFFGGLMEGAAASLAFIRHFRLPLRVLMDAAAPALALGHAVGRVGCFLGGCCYGQVTKHPWAVVYNDMRAPATALSQGLEGLHPVQLYEASGLLAICIGLLVCGRLSRLKGSIFAIYLLAYAGLRLFTETLRADPERGRWLMFSTSQWIAISAVCAGLLLLWWNSGTRKRLDPPSAGGIREG
jgi:phosphatidylglycerol:prolipoprotein diacylglycerol transferase